MARKVYNKLIRDRIPEIIRKNGNTYEVAILPEDQYKRALTAKLVEEASEAHEAAVSGADLSTEIADLFEVIDAVISAHNLDRSAILELQKKRHFQRGGFEKRLNLLWVE